MQSRAQTALSLERLHAINGHHHVGAQVVINGNQRGNQWPSPRGSSGCHQLGNQRQSMVITWRELRS